MRPDNTSPLISAARKRHELTRSKAIRAIRELDHAGTPITFEAVVRAAGVSRSWLYAQSDIRAEIQRLRETTQRAPTPPIPASQRASDTSLLRRLAEANQRNRLLAEENKRLRRQLAHALGDQRAARLTDTGEPEDRTSITIKPRRTSPEPPHQAMSTTPSSTQSTRSQP
jgi:hypothetical protein